MGPPCCPPVVALGTELCPVPAFGSSFFSLCGAQRPARCPQHGDPCPQHQAPSPSWSPRAAAAPSASPSSLRAARGSHSSHTHVAFPHRHRVHQCGGAGKGGQDAEPPERGVQTGSCHHSGESPRPGPHAQQQPQLPAQLSWDMGFLLPPLTAWYPPPQPTSEEDLCPICYAHPISAIFRPCSHKSCK